MDKLIKELINQGYLKTKRIIKAFEIIKREDFVLEEFKNEAKENYPISIGYGQTISQPLVVALMLELLQPKEGEKALDIGSGSGWTTALLAELVGENGKVIGIERIPDLKNFGEKNVSKYNFVASGRVFFVIGDGSKGYEKEAPFDIIHVGAAAVKIPEPLLKQLAIGGRMVIPQGLESQELVLIKKIDENKFKEKRLPGFNFVPLIEEK